MMTPNDYPKLVPDVYVTSDGKLHSSQMEAIAHQKKLDWEIPLQRAETMYNNSRRHFERTDCVNAQRFILCLVEQGFKLTRDE